LVPVRRLESKAEPGKGSHLSAGLSGYCYQSIGIKSGMHF
jgi:hypothetical protein